MKNVRYEGFWKENDHDLYANEIMIIIYSPRTHQRDKRRKIEENIQNPRIENLIEKTRRKRL